MAKVTFTNAAVAEKFVRCVAIRGALNGCGFWDAEKWLRVASRYAAYMEPEHAATVAKMAGGKGVSFDGVFCQCCGTRLSAPDSVATGIGPKCQAA